MSIVKVISCGIEVAGIDNISISKMPKLSFGKRVFELSPTMGGTFLLCI
jgi:hypothetical protein